MFNIDKSIRKALNVSKQNKSFIKIDMFSKPAWFAASTRIPRLPQRQPQPYITQKPISQPQPFIPQKSVKQHLDDEANESFEEHTMNKLTDSGKKYVMDYKEKHGRYPAIFSESHFNPIDKTKEIKSKSPFFDVQYHSKDNKPEVQNINRGPLNLKLSKPLNWEEVDKVRAFNNPGVYFPPRLPKTKLEFEEFHRKQDEENKIKKEEFDRAWNEGMKRFGHLDENKIVRVRTGRTTDSEDFNRKMDQFDALFGGSIESETEKIKKMLENKDNHKV